MYTDEMRKAFKLLDTYRPKRLDVRIEDNEYFLVVRVTEKSFMSLNGDREKRQAFEYLVRVKKAFEELGAIVQLIREGGVE